MVFLKNSFFRRYSNFLLSYQPFKKLTKKVGPCCNSLCIFLIFLVFSFKARRGLQRQKFSAQANTARSPTPHSVSHFWIFRKFNCQLRAQLANFGFSKNIRHFLKYHHIQQILNSKKKKISLHSAHCQPSQSPTLGGVSLHRV